MKSITLTCLVVTLTLLVTGCSSGDAVRYYLIEPVSTGGTSIERDLSVEIVDLEIPQYLERVQIASRRPDSQLVFASSHQWAESLRKNLTRVMARNLTNLLGTAAIGTPANRLSAPADLRLTVYIEQFERGADGYVHLVARCQLIDREARKTLVNSSDTYMSDQRIDSRDYAGTVRAMSELLGELSETISARIEESQ